MNTENTKEVETNDATVPELNDLLCALSRDEINAFTAFFYGGMSEVTKYENSNHVFFGKRECERVDFEEFWLEKMVEYGWIEVELIKSFVAIGAVDKPKAKKYKLTPTDIGYKAKELSRGLKYT